MKSITNLALETQREAAEKVVVRHKKEASFRLYAILVPCLELIERCECDPADRQEFDQLLADKLKNTERHTYIDKESDIYVRVCRFVFDGTNLSNAIRYSQALREAAKLQIRSADLDVWLRTNGGVNALYFRRPLEKRITTTKTLHLTKPLQFSRDEPITVTLRWRNDNMFEVI